MSSILKKALMALSGLALTGFLVVHLAGNFLLYAGPAKFDGYAHTLESNPLLIPAEIVLVAIFVFHVVSALRLTLENNSARPQGYEVNDNQSPFASRWMWISGLLILFFIIVHIKMFKFGEKRAELGLWQLVVNDFQDPLVVFFYVFCMGILGIHLSHGIASAFQSIGILNPTWRARAKSWGTALGWLLALGFALLPLWAFVAKPKAEPAMIEVRIR